MINIMKMKKKMMIQMYMNYSSASSIAPATSTRYDGLFVTITGTASASASISSSSLYDHIPAPTSLSSLPNSILPFIKGVICISGIYSVSLPFSSSENHIGILIFIHTLISMLFCFIIAFVCFF